MRPLLFIIMTLFLTLPAHASVDAERENLARLVKEIDYLIHKVDEIQVDAPANVRVQFRYDLLKEDLVRMRQGIKDHINGSLDSARPVPPMHGVYRQ